MSEETQKTNEQLDIKDALRQTSAATAKAPVDMSWEFEGKKYDLLLVNRTGGIGMPILNPKDKQTVIGILTAEFMWQNSEPFIDRLNIETIDKANPHEDWTERENENMILKNARCFSEIVQRGSASDIDEATGERGAEVPKTREQMLAYRKVVQSDLIGLFLREFHVERWLPEGMTKLDSLLSNPSELFFTVKIGDYNNPRHLLFIECDVPSDDAISNYKSDTFHQSQNDEGDWRYKRNNEKRLRFGKKYVRSVQGAMLGPEEILEFDDSAIRLANPNDEKWLQDFKRNFNPDWFIRIAEEIAGAFDLGKK